MVTNGNKMADMNFAKKFFDLQVVGSIVFSIHGSNEDIHDKLSATP